MHEKIGVDILCDLISELTLFIKDSFPKVIPGTIVLEELLGFLILKDKRLKLLEFSRCCK